MSVLVGTQEVLKLHNKEPGKARPANREQSAVEGCPRVAYGSIGGVFPTNPLRLLTGPPPGGRGNRRLPQKGVLGKKGGGLPRMCAISTPHHTPTISLLVLIP